MTLRAGRYTAAASADGGRGSGVVGWCVLTTGFLAAVSAGAGHVVTLVPLCQARPPARLPRPSHRCPVLQSSDEFFFLSERSVVDTLASEVAQHVMHRKRCLCSPSVWIAC
ncbi:uncharacterized protein LOC143288206 [Babylonia areolata]|uniref:uncharacterized protein LOC143288206 n=1 Tax=Babylonia areolata TaxID=304850 RepID=UPI003FD4F0DD